MKGRSHQRFNNQVYPYQTSAHIYFRQKHNTIDNQNIDVMAVNVTVGAHYLWLGKSVIIHSNIIMGEQVKRGVQLHIE